MKEAIITTIVGLVMTSALVFAIIYGTSKSDQNECLKLQAQAVALYAAPFYITADEKEQCDYYSISINAPVK